MVARDRAGDPSMWVGTCGSGLGARGQGRRWGEGQAWVVGGKCILVGLCRHVCGVIGMGASGKQRARVASDENSTRPRCGVLLARQMVHARTSHVYIKPHPSHPGWRGHPQ